MKPEQREWLETYFESDNLLERNSFVEWFNEQLHEAQLEGARMAIKMFWSNDDPCEFYSQEDVDKEAYAIVAKLEMK